MEDLFLFLRLVGSLNFPRSNRIKVVVEKNILFSRIDREYTSISYHILPSFPSISLWNFSLDSSWSDQSCRWEKHVVLRDRRRIDRENTSILVDISPSIFHHPFLRLIESVKFFLGFKVAIAKDILFSRIEGGSIEKISKLVDIDRSTRLSFRENVPKCESRYEMELERERERNGR